MVYHLPYNPQSQGVVHQFHKTVKVSLYSLYSDKKDIFNLINVNELDIAIKKYNNHVHCTIKFTPNQIAMIYSRKFY